MIPKNEHRKVERRLCRRRKNEEEKELRGLMREFNRLSRVVWETPLVKLERPYQRGWQRYFRLTDRAKRRKNAAQLEALLDFVDNRQFCRKNRFRKWNRRRKQFVTPEHRLRKLTVCQVFWNKVPDHLLKYFRGPGRLAVNRNELREWRSCGWNGRLAVNHPHYFESVIEPWIITHQRADLPEVKSRLDEIEAFFDANDGWQRYDRLRGYRVSNWRRDFAAPRHRELERIIGHEIEGALLEASVPILKAMESPSMGEDRGTMKIVPFFFPELTFSKAA